MNIRLGASSDVDRLEEILRSTALFTDDDMRWAMEYIDLALRRGTRQRQQLHVLEETDGPAAGTVQGYVCFGATPRAEGVWEIYWIAVDASAQGRGFGTTLLRFAETEVRQNRGRMLMIETSSKLSYAPTIRFYRRHGYEEVSRIKDYYRIEDDKIIFRKQL